MVKVRMAKETEYAKIRDFYYSLIDAMKNMEYKPEWKRDVYPTQEFLQESIRDQELYVGELDGKMVSCISSGCFMKIPDGRSLSCMSILYEHNICA